MSNSLFITGTDTDVGKTVVTAGIVRWLRSRGVDAVPMKPVQTGGKLVDGQPVAPDLYYSLAASALRPDREEINLMSPYVYEPACSPHLAGRMANHYAEIAVIKDCAGKLLARHQAVIVEGAGGVLAPLNEKETMLDLMEELAYPVILVARIGLGTINHTLLSIRALRESGLTINGVVFCHNAPSDSQDCFIEEDNPLAVAQFGKVKVLGNIRFLENLSPVDESAWQQFAQDMTGAKDIADALGVPYDR
jgi:dethiobiotin synthetase